MPDQDNPTPPTINDPASPDGPSFQEVADALRDPAPPERVVSLSGTAHAAAKASTGAEPITIQFRMYDGIVVGFKLPRIESRILWKERLFTREDLLRDLGCVARIHHLSLYVDGACHYESDFEGLLPPIMQVKE